MLSKLTPKQQFMLAALVCALALVIWYFLYFNSQKLQIDGLNQQLTDSQVQVDSFQRENAQLPGLRTEVAGLKATSDAFYAALPRTQNIGTVVDAVRLNVLSNGGVLTSLNSGAGSLTNLPPGVRPISLSLNMVGQFKQTFQVLRAMETMSRFSNIAQLNMSLPAPNSFDPSLNTSMIATVYTYDPDAAGGVAGAPGAPVTPGAAATPAGTPAVAGTPSQATPAPATTGGGK